MLRSLHGVNSRQSRGSLMDQVGRSNAGHPFATENLKRTVIFGAEKVE